jgi:hypothetical protein
MPNKLKLPFILNGGNKKSFKLLNDKEITKKSLKQSAGMLDYLQKLMFENNSLEKNSNLTYVKASDTKKYYKKLKNRI